jgi:hypothetical protein
LGNRSAVYRHARALDLSSKRVQNVRAALERLIEKVDNVPATASAIIQAIVLLARINVRGELVEQDEQLGVHDLFARMTREEYEAYAKDGTVPNWFPRLKARKTEPGTGGNENV